MLPAMHQAGGGMKAPVSCRADLQRHCGAARSQVHCLGQHEGDISEACRNDVGKSVPFLCSQSIDRYCDIMQSGILACLSSHLGSLSDTCRDAVTATQRVISK